MQGQSRRDLTAPLSPAASAALARLELAFALVLAEQLRVERLVSGLRVGESTVIGGTPVTVVSLVVADAITAYETAARRAARLAARAESGGMSDLDADSLAHAEELMAGARATLADAGMLHLVGGA
jgi:hypothetical protein